ncbi:2-isopropylmalate synthase, partial [Francisella tularensis subsp. holarctica]|nr:2-isopropylmalate synthase [Francisella tularensis subsp. holarctica]
GLCQLRNNQVEITMDALRPSLAIGIARVHMYLPVDPNLAQASLGSKNDNETNNKNVYELFKLATDEGFEVQYRPQA